MSDIGINVNFNAPAIFVSSVPSNLALKIKTIIIEIFKNLINAATFPLRYLGSKTWSFPGAILNLPLNMIKGRPVFNNETGYHFETEKELSPDELRPFLKYAAVSAASFATDSKWLQNLEGLEFHQLMPRDIDIAALPPGIEIIENCLFDPTTGLKIVIVKNEHELVIAFGARGSTTSALQNEMQIKEIRKNQAFSGAGNFFGGRPSLYSHAADAIKIIKNSNLAEGRKISLTGQSLGGSLAEYTALRLKIPAICFNSFPLGVGLQSELGVESLAQADEFVTHISAQNDIYSDNVMTRAIDRIVNLFGLKTPGNYGRRYSIPSAYPDNARTHNYVLGNIMHHLNYDTRCLPKDVIFAEDLIDQVINQPAIFQFDSPELVKNILIKTIKSSFSSDQNVTLDSFSTLDSMSDNDVANFLEVLNFYAQCYKNKFNTANAHIDRTILAVEHAIFLRINQNNAIKTKLLHLA
ncbi:MAG: hypothetical protein H0V82_07620 [Candidatus Protochlamydia sp.]|nr:hypothetical protein [Candidatus Protochlamydia sp.]